MHAAAPVLCDVLVVEDDHDTRDVMVGLLRRAGCDVRAAASAGEALLQIEGSLPTHIMLDLLLPDAGGVVVLRAIRRRQLPVRVAVLTAAGPRSAAVTEAQQWDPEAVFFKPIRFAEIETWLAQPP